MEYEVYTYTKDHSSHCVKIAELPKFVIVGEFEIGHHNAIVSAKDKKEFYDEYYLDEELNWYAYEFESFLNESSCSADEIPPMVIHF